MFKPPPGVLVKVESRNAAKRLIEEILAIAGGSLAGETRLHKAFYASHLYYWQLGAGVLTDWPIVRLPFGPGIDDAKALLAELVNEKRVRRERQPAGPYWEAVFHLAERFEVDPTTPRHTAIEKAVNWVKPLSAAELSAATHEYSRAWRDGSNGAELDIYADLLGEDETQQIRENIARAKAALESLHPR
jgi:hypothetical protein